MKSRYVISTDEARRNCISDIESLDTEGGKGFGWRRKG